MATYFLVQTLRYWIGEPIFRVAYCFILLGLWLVLAVMIGFFIGGGFYLLYLGVVALVGQSWWAVGIVVLVSLPIVGWLIYLTRDTWPVFEIVDEWRTERRMRRESGS